MPDWMAALFLHCPLGFRHSAVELKLSDIRCVYVSHKYHKCGPILGVGLLRAWECVGRVRSLTAEILHTNLTGTQ